jgi:hypothetical protein
MSLAPSSILRRVVDAIEGTGGPVAWRESPIAFPLFPSPAAQDFHHRTYAVGLPSTSAGAGRQRSAEGAMSTTSVVVRYVCRLRPDAGSADYVEAVESEEELVRVIAAGLERSPDLELRLVGTSRSAVIGEAAGYLGEIRYEARHLYPLESEE